MKRVQTKDEDRHTVKITLRLDPELAERFRAIKAAWKKRGEPFTFGDALEGLLDRCGA